MPSEQPPAERREVNVRRAPKYVPFLILGAVLALVLDRRSIRRQQRAVVEAVPDSEPDTDLQP